MKQHLKLNQVRVLCRLVECLTTTIVLHKKGIDFENESDSQADSSEKLSVCWKLADIPPKMLMHFNVQCGSVEDFIKGKLRDLEYSSETEWDEELQVSVATAECDLMGLWHRMK